MVLLSQNASFAKDTLRRSFGGEIAKRFIKNFKMNVCGQDRRNGPSQYNSSKMGTHSVTGFFDCDLTHAKKE